MIFVGDIALPNKRAIEIVDLPPILLNKQWVGNLEGCILQNDYNKFKRLEVVFNDEDAIEDLIKNINFKGFVLGNNHILDHGELSDTIDFLHRIKMPYCGVGLNLQEAANPLLLTDNRKQIVILNFGWEVIQCQIAKEDDFGVNPLERQHVIDTVKNAVERFPNSYIIPFMHWSYELESEPQPFERQLAKTLIDLGVAGVIGCHPHRIGGFEIYKGKPILYSLGNWMFKQRYYHNSKLKFPEFCNHEVAFEWDFDNNSFLFHFFRYDSTFSTLTYINTEKQDSKTMHDYTPFRDFSDSDYKVWYKKNHYHRRKGLPIYYWEDSELRVIAKNVINKIRDNAISLLSKIR